MKKVILFLGISIIFFGIVCPAVYGYEVKCGNIPADETWSGRIYISDDVSIAGTATVTISPGCIIKFNTDTEIYCAGNIWGNTGVLIADGTSSDKIYFTSKDDTSAEVDGVWGIPEGESGLPQPGDWQWLRWDYPATRRPCGSGVTQAVIRYAVQGIRDTYHGRMEFNNLEISHSADCAIYIQYDPISTSNLYIHHNRSGLRIHGGTVTNSEFGYQTDPDWFNGYGIFSTGTPVIENCYFHDNQQSVIWYYPHPESMMKNCIIENSSRRGMYLHHTNGTILNCTFYGNRTGIHADYADGMLYIKETIIAAGTSPLRGDYGIYVTWDPAKIDISYSNVFDHCFHDLYGTEGEIVPGPGYISEDPFFVSPPDRGGSYWNYFLSQTIAGQEEDSPCIAGGDPSSSIIGGTTRTDFVADEGIVNMGYHYPLFDDPFAGVRFLKNKENFKVEKGTVGTLSLGINNSDGVNHEIRFDAGEDYGDFSIDFPGSYPVTIASGETLFIDMEVDATFAEGDAYDVEIVLISDGQPSPETRYLRVYTLEPGGEFITRGGHIYKDEVWDEKVYIRNDIEIHHPARIWIKPGTTIKFNSDTEIYCPASQWSPISRLIADGIPAQKFYFTSKEDTSEEAGGVWGIPEGESGSPEPGDWKWLRWNWPSPCSVVTQAVIRYAQQGISDPYHGRMEFNNLEISHCSDHAIYIQYDPISTSNLYIHHNRSGLKTGWVFGDATITDSEFSHQYGTDWSTGYGIRTGSGTNAVIENCYFNDNHHGVIWYYPKPDSVLKNCIIANSSRHGMYFHHTNGTILNCTFYGNEIGLKPDFTDGILYVTNTIVAAGETGRYGICAGGDGSRIDISYSDVYGHSMEDLCATGAPIIPGPGYISEGPLLAEPATEDFHLQPGSPCIDTGTNDAPGLPETDYDGNPRITDGDYDGAAVVDMGALECLGIIIPAIIDIEPDTLNRKSRGRWVTCHIELAEDYNVEDIDIDSVALTKINDELLTPPLYTVGHSEIGDYDCDGSPDLMVKFDRQELILLLEVGDAEFTVSGQLVDGAAFEGSDVVRVK